MTNHMSDAQAHSPYYWYGWVWAAGTGEGFKEGGGPYFRDYYGYEFKTQEAAQLEGQRQAEEFNASYVAGSAPRVMVATWGVAFRGVEDVGNPPALFESRWNREELEWEWTLN